MILNAIMFTGTFLFLKEIIRYRSNRKADENNPVADDFDSFDAHDDFQAPRLKRSRSFGRGSQKRRVANQGVAKPMAKPKRNFRFDSRKDPDLVKNYEWKEYIKLYKKEAKTANWKARIYTNLPHRLASRIWGWLHQRTIPKFLRPLAYTLYIKMTGVLLHEAKNQNLKDYENLNKFFTREIQQEKFRPTASAKTTDLVSPVDGRVLSVGRICENNKLVKQVKGIDYSLKALLGPNPNAVPDKDMSKTFLTLDDVEYKNSYLKNPEKNDMFYAVIYLAPGDYHRFHSPTELKITSRRHFPGDLFSVNPSIANWLKNLFALNERVILNGNWKHGYFSYTAVGATLVGSMKIYFDEKVETSKPHRFTKAYKHNGIYFDRKFEETIELGRGDVIGEFNIGSTVILCFEAPKEFEFAVENGEKVFLGRSLGK